MDPVVRFRNSVKERLDSADLLVAKLIHENTLLIQQLDTKKQELGKLQNKIDDQESEIQLLKSRETQVGEQADILKDLFEHLCDVRVHKSYEDDTGLWFDVSQGSSRALMDYKLGFVHSASEEQGVQVIYVPLLKQRSAEELRSLQANLPNYMFDTLSFPLGSLSQFYSKMARSLNKKK